MTLLVLLPAAAGARVVPADAGPLADDRLRRLRRPLQLSVVACAPLHHVPLTLRHLTLEPLRLLGRALGHHPHQLADELVLDGREHLHEALVPFLLVLLLRVLLAVAA